MNLDKYKVTIDEDDQRFEINTDSGETAYIDYRWYKDMLVLLYIYVPIPYRGKGLSHALNHFALEYAKEKGVKVKVYCPYIAKYVRTHPEYESMMEV